MLHETLWRANVDLARACLDHAFVRGLADGSLGREAFKRYVAQDAYFLTAFVRAYAIAAARSHAIEHIRRFHGFMSGALEELKLHAVYSEKLGINLTHVRPYPATRAYTEFLLARAWHAGLDETLAAMTPCMRLYVYLGQALAKASPPDNPYGEWIDTYAGDPFQKVAGDVESLLETVAIDTPGVRAAYRYAMQCELEFFSAPLEGA